MQVFSVLFVPLTISDFRLSCLQACRMVQISMRHGTSGDSAAAYAWWAYILAGVKSGENLRRDGNGCRLDAADRGRDRFLAKKAFGLQLRRVLQPMLASICGMSAIPSRAERSLDLVWREAEMALDVAREAKFGDAVALFESHQRFIATMQGRTATFSTFNDAHFDEATFEARLTGDRMPALTCWYWVIKLKARLLSGDYVEALATADKAKALLPDVVDHSFLPDYFYYAALTVSALYETASDDEQQAWGPEGAPGTTA
jgi:hypothetical protein